MKNKILLLAGLLLFANCKENTNKVEKAEKSISENKKAKTVHSKNVDFDCNGFFEKGDYSASCFINSKLPEHSGFGCLFNFTTPGDKQEQKIKVQFTGKSSAALAESSFSLEKNSYTKGKLVEVPNLGDTAFFDLHTTDLKSLSSNHKDLYVLYNNISFKILTEYRTASEKPCFFEDKELIGFAQTIIENMNGK